MALNDGPTSALDLDELDDIDDAMPVGMSAADFAVRVPVAARSPAATDRAAVAAVAKPATVRLPMFDAMRVVAAFGVVWMHTPQGGTWLKVAQTVRFGVAFFTMAALILLARSLDRRPEQRLLDYARTRASRLLVPLVLWSAVYVAFYLAINHWLGTPIFLEANVGLLLGGAATHLWFLPFILFACVAAFPLLQAAQAAPQHKRWLVPALLAAGAASVLIPKQYDQLGRGAQVFFFNATWAAPTYFFGLAAAMVYPKELAGRWRVLVPLAGVLMFAVAATCAWKGVSSPAIQAAKGLAVAMVALTPWSPKVIQWLGKLGTLSFGVYLVHLLFVVSIREVGKRYVSPDAVWFYPAVALLAFVTSYAVAVAANRTKLGKVMFP